MTIGLALLGLIIVILVIIGITQTYVKAPPNVALIISGWTKEPRILKGQGGIRIPFFLRSLADHLFLLLHVLPLALA